MPVVPVAPKNRQQFDYTSLDADTSVLVQQRTGEIRALMKRTAQGIVEIGLKLIEVKERLAHGYFGGWLEAEFEWSQDTATNFMRVAQRFGNNPKISDFAPSALYLFAAPSTPEPAIEEALERAAAGESITYKTAVAIKQKHTTKANKPQAKTKPESKPETQTEPKPTSLPTPTPTLASATLPPGKKLEIVAIRPKAAHSPTESTASRSATPLSTKTPSVSHHATAASDELGVWWQLGQHLLYCGNPESPDFLKLVTQEVPLLIAFPPTSRWQSSIAAKTRIITTNYSPQGKDAIAFEDTLESIILLCSDVCDLIVSCFLPSPEILSLINRQERRGLFAEPDEQRVKTIITDWKKAGLKVERVELG